MDLYDLMKKRHSVRSFSKKDFSEEKLQRVLKSGCYAPSGADKKPFTCIVVENLVLKNEIKDFCEETDRESFED
ncbi:MAG: nitroreductase family protein, partial [Candidatus Thermoplasmatota archaeon]